MDLATMFVVSRGSGQHQARVNECSFLGVKKWMHLFLVSLALELLDVPSEHSSLPRRRFSQVSWWSKSSSHMPVFHVRLRRQRWAVFIFIISSNLWKWTIEYAMTVGLRECAPVKRR